MDVVQNSISAAASLITVKLEENKATGRLTIAISDNGCGMTPEQLKNVQSPFFTTRTTRSVGLGVPLFKMASEMTGGSFNITSKLGEGTTTTAEFVYNHIDMTPVGDINETVLLLVYSNPDIDFVYEKSVTGEDGTANSFELDTRELREVLGEDVPLNSPDVTAWIREFLKEQDEQL